MKIRKHLIVGILICFSLVIYSQKKKGDKYFEKGLYAKAIPYYAKASKKSSDEQSVPFFHGDFAPCRYDLLASS